MPLRQQTRDSLPRLPDLADMDYTRPVYHFDKPRSMRTGYLTAKERRKADEPLRFGPNIKDWPQMVSLPENLLIKVVSEIHDPVTTTDELIPSGETSSYRSNPLALAEFALSRKDPAYVGRAKEVQLAEKAREEGKDVTSVLPEIGSVWIS